MLNKSKKNLMLALLFVLIGSLVAAIVLSVPNIYQAHASELNNEQGKYYCHATLEDEFADDKVIIMLNSEESLKLKDYTVEDFSDIATVYSVTELTSYTKELLKKNYSDEYLTQNTNTRDLDKFNSILCLTLNEHSKQNVLDVIRILEKKDWIISAEPDYIMESNAVPNDEYFESGDLWWLNGEYGIGAQGAWDLTTGSSLVKVGIIDSGIDIGNSDLTDNIGSLNIDLRDNEYKNSPLIDYHGHGTAIAGIIGAVGNNSKGITGINWDVDLVSLKINDDTKTDDLTSMLIAAIDYAAANGIDILNNSNSYSNFNNGPSGSVNNALNKYSGLFVNSAGNTGRCYDDKPYGIPADTSLDNVIAVGAIQKDGARWKNNNLNSCYGDSVNIFAPGGNILTTAISYNETYNGEYNIWSGTSFAAPMVSGVAALMLSLDSDLTAAEIKEMILESAIQHTIDTPNGEMEVKLLNAENALKLVEYNLEFPEFTVKLDHNDSTGNYEEIDVRYNQGMPEGIEAPIRDDYIFLGYYSSGANGIMYYDENMNPVKAWDKKMDGTLYAHWRKAIRYNIKFDAKGGTGGTTIINVREGDRWPKIEVPSKVGATFKGYYYAHELENYKLFDSNGNFCPDNILLGGDEVIALGEDITLFAGWETNYYSIIFDVICPTSGSLNSKIIQVKYDQNYTYTAPSNYEYNGKTFAFERWILINNLSNWDMEDNPWIEYQSAPELNFKVSDIINNYYPDLDWEGDLLQFRAVYQSPPSCIKADTYITLADGTQKSVELLTGDEMLLVWNMYTGMFDTAPILCIDSDPLSMYEVIQLSFSDGTTVDVISEHGFFDVDLNRYVYLDENAAEYIGHSFLKQDESHMVQVTLEDVSITQECTMAYSPVTYGHLCYYVNGMLSMPGGIDGLFNIFEVDTDTMMYDLEAMVADIEQYGLYTYEELSVLVPVTEKMFEAVNAQYLKVAVGKGMITVEQIGELIEKYGDMFE